MGMTIEFYAAEPEEFVELFATTDATGDFDRFFEQLETYPVADFSFHLWYPDDLDSMCQILSKQDCRIPHIFNDVLEKTVWSDGLIESVTLLDRRFVSLLAAMSESQIEVAALVWAATHPCDIPLQQTPAFQALLSLHDIAKEAIAHNSSLLFYLEGNPAFFRW